jgi:hypothetical protein
MTDAELAQWWPHLGKVVADLRRIHQAAVADRLVDAVRGGATSSEILGEIGIVLRHHYPLRSQLSDAAASAWDTVMADVHRAFPGSRLADWWARLTGR